MAFGAPSGVALPVEWTGGDDSEAESRDGQGNQPTGLERQYAQPRGVNRGDIVTLALGVYDIFAYGIPGALYLVLLVYISDRSGWLDFKTVIGVSSTLFSGPRSQAISLVMSRLCSAALLRGFCRFVERAWPMPGASL